MIDLPTTGPSNNDTNNRESGSTKILHEDENDLFIFCNRKIYPQRNNRAKLNYRDLEQGMYEEIRQSIWSTHGGSRLINKNIGNESEEIDLTLDDDDDDEEDDDDEQNESEQVYRRLWCICQKPWDHSKLMLRCDSCANWYHGDCIGITKEQGKILEMSAEQFVCPPCQGITQHVKTKSAKSSDESILIKRKHSDDTSSRNNDRILSKNISHDKSTKRSKVSQNDSTTKSETDCIVNGCNKWVKSNWVYCSSACIRLHINDTLQAIQRSKGEDNDDLPTRDDILLYEKKTKTNLAKYLVPNIEDLSTWINQHPSYEIIKPTLRESNSLPTSLTRSISSVMNTTKSKTSSTLHQEKNTKFIAIKKNTKQISKTTTNANNTTDIRSKVPTALYDKIIMRLEKNGEQDLIKGDIRTIVTKIEEEMYRIYGKIDNSYKNKFRSLLANISNINNNYFYKQILSKELTAKQIVAMKSEDMLPPEEKEKRKDEFDKEIQMILQAGAQTTEDMARCAKIKASREGLIDNNTVSSKEQSPSEENISHINPKSIEIKPIPKKSIPITTPTKAKLNIQPTKTTIISSIPKESNSVFPLVDLDNDYIEPESPTGIDALIYDDNDDNDEDLTNSSRSTTIQQSPIDNNEHHFLSQQIIRDDYNPSKTTPINQSTLINPLPKTTNQWCGIIYPHDAKIPCQSIQIYGDCNYLIDDIPEQLIILGRLRLTDLWDYIRESLIVRDVLILTLSSSSLNNNDKEIFSRYVDVIRSSKRAAVISKRADTSFIRDMYILAADTIDCPSNVLSTLSLPMTIDSNQLFLVIIGSGKRTIKSINRVNENQSWNNLTYKPALLQESTVVRDPRLSRNKDPRLNGDNVSTSQLISNNNSKQLPTQYTNEDLLKLITDSLVRVRHSPTADGVRPIVMSTMEVLKGHKRDDLCARFTTDLRLAMAEWQAARGTNSSTTIVIGDNLIEENMDVDDEQDDKQKKTPSSTSSDVDYRFLNQNTSHPITQKNQQRTRKSRFSDPSSTHRVTKSKSNISIDKVFSKEEKRPDSNKMSSSDKNNINILLNNKFRPIINLTESFILSTNTKEKLTSKPIRFSFSKDPLRKRKPNISSTITNNNNDIYESSPKFIEDLIKQIQSYGYQSFSFSNKNWTKQTLPTVPLRSKAMVNLIIQQQKTKSRLSSSTNEWRSSNNNNNNNNHMTHYHDFDRPQE